MKIGLTALFLIMLILVVIVSASDRIPIQSETLKYKYQALVTKRLLLIERQTNLANLYNQVQREIESMTQQINPLRTELYKAQELKEDDYDLDWEAGEFVKKDKK